MADPAVHAASPLNVPNALTMARIAMVPALLVALFSEPNGSMTAAGLFALASATDALDGHLARSRGLVTDIGKVLDPLADKLLVVSVLLSLMVLDRVAVWVVAVILGREVAVSLLRTYAGRYGLTVPARMLGKVKMTLQVAAVLLLLAAPDPTAVFVDVVLYSAVAVTIASGVDCALHVRSRLRAVRRRSA
jgi:CDP-diacylglycerol--glycerol-3-phosphate 3-phosphatidyltransferase